MESIAVTKPNMGVLPQKRLLLSPFGTLAQTFSEQLLARAGFEEGRWPFLPLDLLEEERSARPLTPVRPVIQMDLNLVLQTLRQTRGRTEWEKATERVVERIIRLRERGSARSAPAQAASRSIQREKTRRMLQIIRTEIAASQAAKREADRQEKAERETRKAAREGARQTARVKREDVSKAAHISDKKAAEEYPFALQQNFYSTVNQHIQFAANLLQEIFAQQAAAPLSRKLAPGGVGRSSMTFFRQFQLLREAERMEPTASAEFADLIADMTELPLRIADGSAFSDWRPQTDSIRIADRRDVRQLAAEELSYLEYEENGAAAEAGETAAIRYDTRRIARQLGQELTAQMAALSARKRSAGALKPGWEAPEPRSEYQPQRHKFDNTASGGKQGIPSDDLYNLTQMIRTADRAVRTADHPSAPDNSKQIRHELESSMQGGTVSEALAQTSTAPDTAARDGALSEAGAERRAADSGGYLTPSVRDIRLTSAVLPDSKAAATAEVGPESEIATFLTAPPPISGTEMVYRISTAEKPAAQVSPTRRTHVRESGRLKPTQDTIKTKQIMKPEHQARGSVDAEKALPGSGIQPRLLSAAARDIRFPYAVRRAPGGGGTMETVWPWPAFLPETMVYPDQKTGEAAAEPQEVQPAVQSTLRSAGAETTIHTVPAARQGAPDAYTWLRERLADRMPPAPPADRTAPEALELTYSSQGQSPETAAAARPQDPAAAGSAVSSDDVRSLPDWARRFLSAPQTQSGEKMGTARNIAALSVPAQEEGFEWTAPNYQPPAPITYRERPEQQVQPQQQNVRISELEVRRAADRIYQMIEDRIRRERRRLGL